eukprot:gene3631-4522_t
MSLHVVYKNNKTTVPVQPSNTLQEILKKACLLFKLPDENAYTFTFNQKPVNLSLPLRLSGIPPQSRLTLIESNSVADTSSKSLKIAIQLESGQRFQSTFLVSLSIWDIMISFEKNNEGLNLISNYDADDQYLIPTISYLNNQQVNTIEQLQSQTLRKLNITEACLFRVSLKPSGLTRDQVKPLIDNYVPPSTNTTSPTTSSPTTTTTTTTTSPTTTTTTSPTTTTTTTTTTTSPTTSSPTSSTTTTSSPTTVYTDINTTTTATTTTTTSKDGDSMEIETEKSRSLRTYIPQQQTPDPNSIEFDARMTTDDVKRLKETVERAKEKEKYESVLRTKSQRERDQMRQLSKFQTTTIRLVFPNQTMLEMDFDAKEKGSALIDYVRTLFKEPVPTFQIYSTPPHKELEKDVSFLKQSLIPSVKLYCGTFGQPFSFTDEVDSIIQSSSNTNTSPTLPSTTTTTTTTTSAPLYVEEEKEDEPMETTTTTTTKSSIKFPTSFDDNEGKPYLDPRKQAITPKWFKAGRQ